MKDNQRTQDHEKKELDPIHAKWLIDSRAETQRASVKLYGLLKSEKYADLEGDLDLEAQMLVAISFSLWRSVFYSDKTGFRDDTNKGAVTLLGEMLQNNAIAYSHERTSKDWTFNYYAGNARYRLRELAERNGWKGELDMGRLNPPAQHRHNPKKRWERLQSAFSTSVDHFEKMLKRK